MLRASWGGGLHFWGARWREKESGRLSDAVSLRHTSKDSAALAASAPWYLRPSLVGLDVDHNVGTISISQRLTV